MSNLTSWFSQLDRAKSIPETINVARHFLAEWSPQDLALIPETCRPGKLRDAQDLESLHACLVETYRASRATGKELDALQRLTSFVVRASIRLAELGGGNGSSGTSGGSGGPSEGPGMSAAPRES